jgi:hypothetical protein
MGTRSSFVSRTPVRLQIEGDERWIEIKPKLGQGDRLNLLDALLEMKALTSKGEVASVAKYGAFVNALLELSITGWHLTDEEGADVPFAAALIASLDPDDPLVELVQREVVARNPLGVTRKTGASE